MESVGNGQEETETDSSSKTFGFGMVGWGIFAVVFTRRTIPRLSGRKRRNNNLVDRGEELGERCVTGRVRCVVAHWPAATGYRIDAQLFHPFHFSFFSLPFLDLDGSFHQFRGSSFLAPESLVDATRFVEGPHRL